MRLSFARKLAFAMCVGGLVAWLCSSPGEAQVRVAEEPRLPSGSYTGAGQRMIIEGDGTIRFHDNLGITHIEIHEDGSLRAFFSEFLPRGPFRLESAASGSRKLWSSFKDGKTLRARAIPFSPELYAFRLEIIEEGKLVAGEQQFYAIRAKTAETRP